VEEALNVRTSDWGGQVFQVSLLEGYVISAIDNIHELFCDKVYISFVPLQNIFVGGQMSTLQDHFIWRVVFLWLLKKFHYSQRIIIVNCQST
jgi:hypothetical protein